MSYELCYEYDINIFGIQIIIKKIHIKFFYLHYVLHNVCEKNNL